jgi:hypothetical protein
VVAPAVVDVVDVSELGTPPCRAADDDVVPAA